MLADFFTKPLQGSLFKKLRAAVMNLDEYIPLPLTTTTRPQECVETSWADVVKSGMVCKLTGSDAVNKKILSSSDRGDVSGRYKKRQ
jgi:hypothetical protein